MSGQHYQFAPTHHGGRHLGLQLVQSQVMGGARSSGHDQGMAADENRLSFLSHPV